MKGFPAKRLPAPLRTYLPRKAHGGT
jgi:hypothetical protein